jgi:hypothetical protein
LAVLPTRLLDALTVPDWPTLVLPVVPSTSVEAPRAALKFGLDTT